MRFSSIVQIVILAVFATVITACEKVIDIELNDTEPRLVVEGNVSNQPGPYLIQLSQSVNYFDKNQFPAATGATVTISDDAGNSDLLLEQQAGMYYTQNLQGTPGRTYTLSIEYNDKRFTASSLMANSVYIDTVFSYYNDGTLSAFAPEGYYVTYAFLDPSGENYYRFQSYMADTLVNSPRGEFIEDSELGAKKGSSTYVFYDPFINFSLEDTVTIKVSGIDKKSFNYYGTLAEAKASGGGGFGSIPQNPPSNVSNDALGFFGAVTEDSVTIIIKE